MTKLLTMVWYWNTHLLQYTLLSSSTIIRYENSRKIILIFTSTTLEWKQYWLAWYAKLSRWLSIQLSLYLTHVFSSFFPSFYSKNGTFYNYRHPTSKSTRINSGFSIRFYGFWIEAVILTYTEIFLTNSSAHIPKIQNKNLRKKKKNRKINLIAPNGKLSA